MNVRLIWVTPDAEKQILYIARVSSEHQESSDTRLISYLIRHHHFSPFEMASMCVEIETSRAIGRQILRHRSFSFQEFSQRYATVRQLERSEARRRAERNRQSSIEDDGDWFYDGEDVRTWWRVKFDGVAIHAEKVYSRALKRGIAPEVARLVLPEASLTRMYMAGTIRSFIHYLQLRTQPETQLEHRQVAQRIREIFVEQFPVTTEALLATA